MKNRFGDRFEVLSRENTLACAFPTEIVVINNLVNTGKIQGAVTIYP